MPEKEVLSPRAAMYFIAVNTVLVVGNWVVYEPFSPEGTSSDLSASNSLFYLLFFVLIGLGLSGIATGKSEWQSLIFCFLIVGFGTQIYLLLAFFYRFIAALKPDVTVFDSLNLGLLKGGVGFSCSVLVAFYPLLRKLHLALLLILLVIFANLYCALQALLLLANNYDPAGLCQVHIFSALAGSSLSSIYRKHLCGDNRTTLSPALSPSLVNILTTLGCLFCFIFLPFIVSNSVSPFARDSTALSLLLAMAASTSAGSLISAFLNGIPEVGKIFAASLAGAFAVSGVSMLGLHPASSLLIGYCAGVGTTLLVSLPRTLKYLLGFEYDKECTIYDKGLNIPTHVLPSAVGMFIQAVVLLVLLQTGKFNSFQEGIIKGLPGGNFQYLYSLLCLALSVLGGLLCYPVFNIVIGVLEKTAWFKEESLELVMGRTAIERREVQLQAIRTTQINNCKNYANYTPFQPNLH